MLRNGSRFIADPAGSERAREREAANARERERARDEETANLLAAHRTNQPEQVPVATSEPVSESLEPLRPRFSLSHTPDAIEIAAGAWNDASVESGVIFGIHHFVRVGALREPLLYGGN